jgi:hypothetical protein
MAFALENNISLSELPPAGTTFRLPDIASTSKDNDTIRYFKQNGIVSGTRGVMPPLTCTTILKPVMTAVPIATEPPHTLGYYSYNLVATSSFTNTFELQADYPSDNSVIFQTEDLYVTGHPSHTTAQFVVSPMASKSVTYRVNWGEGFGYMMVWSDMAVPITTATFRDMAGNQALVAPVLVFDNLSQDLIMYLIADIMVETVMATSDVVTIRLTRSHSSILLADFAHHSMNWINDTGATLEPDPLDPTNPDKALVSLALGIYTVGVQTDYELPGIATYPPSTFTMVIRVS